MPGTSFHHVQLRKLLTEAEFVNCSDLSPTSVTCDSRAVVPGSTFVAIPGSQTDGHDFIDQALANGATSVITSRPVELSVPGCITPCTATAFARVSAALQLGPQPPLTCVGVTGTNGKTTTTWMLRSILAVAGHPCGLLGTIEYGDGVSSEPAHMTTPPADRLADMMRSMIDHGTSHCVMEVSSHALVQKRCAGVDLAAAAITNITQDHFDYHKSAGEYVKAKIGIKDLLHTDAPLLINLGDAGCRSVLSEVAQTHSVVTFGIDQPDAELNAGVVRASHRSQHIELHLAQGDATVRLRLIGRHNAENALLAAGLAEQLGVRLKDIVDGLEKLHNVPGRLERIDEGQSFQVFVDYAHTADGLKHVLSTVRECVPGRVICVFGAGGDRDRSKRSEMGRVAAAADVPIVTSDNPRTESPLEIINDILEGAPQRCHFVSEVNRRVAIERAFALAEPGDAVLIAGKGHENGQQFANAVVEFDDRAVCRELLRQSHSCSPSAWNPSSGSLARTA